MTPADLLAYSENMKILEAEEELRAGVDDDDRVYDLVLAATGSAERASEALTARIVARQKQNAPTN